MVSEDKSSSNQNNAGTVQCPLPFIIWLWFKFIYLQPKLEHQISSHQRNTKNWLNVSLSFTKLSIKPTCAGSLGMKLWSWAIQFITSCAFMYCCSCAKAARVVADACPEMARFALKGATCGVFHKTSQNQFCVTGLWMHLIARNEISDVFRLDILNEIHTW